MNSGELHAGVEEVVEAVQKTAACMEKQGDIVSHAYEAASAAITAMDKALVEINKAYSAVQKARRVNGEASPSMNHAVGKLGELGLLASQNVNACGMKKGIEEFFATFRGTNEALHEINGLLTPERKEQITQFGAAIIRVRELLELLKEKNTHQQGKTSEIMDHGDRYKSII